MPNVFHGVIDFNWSRSTSSVVRSFRAPVIHHRKISRHGEEKNGSRLRGTIGYGQKMSFSIFAHNPSIKIRVRGNAGASPPGCLFLRRGKGM